MLLIDTIKRSTSAIKERRAAQESKKSADEYRNALDKLNRASEDLKLILHCAAALKDKGIVEKPPISQQTRDELIDCANTCGKGVADRTLTLDMVAVLKAKSDSIARELQARWKEAAAQYSDGTKGYLSMVGGLSDDPKRARELADNITKTVEGALSIIAIDKLVAYVAEAKKITEAFSLNPEIEGFLKRVSSQQATVRDLTPNIINWLSEKNLTQKLKIRF